MQDAMINYFKDTTLLREKYHIPSEDIDKYNNEVNFIIEYRKKLSQIFKNLYGAYCAKQNNSKDQMKKCEQEVIKNTVQLAQDLTEFMGKADTENIMRKFVFVRNITKEVEFAFNNYFTGGYFSNDLYGSNSYNIETFLQYVCFEKLYSYNFAADLLIKKNDENVNMLIEGMKDRFNYQTNKSNYNEKDLYLLYGYFLNKYQEKENKGPSACEGCEKDDCMYCNYLGESSAYDKYVKEYRDIKDLIAKKINQESISMEEINRAYNFVEKNDSDFKDVFYDILVAKKVDKVYDKKYYKIGNIDPINLQRDKIFAKMKSKVGDRNFTSLNADQFAAFVLDKFYQLESDDGDKLIFECDALYYNFLSGFYRKQKEGSVDKPANDINFANLIDEYEAKNSSSVKGGE